MLVQLQEEARLAKDRNFLILFPGVKLDHLALNQGETFCGEVYNPENDNDQPPPNITNQNIFVAGDVAKASKKWLALLIEHTQNNAVFIVRDLCKNYEQILPCVNFANLGNIPILVNELGVLYKNFFPTGYFQKVQAEHEFQALRFSNKPGVALRTGVYMTPVTVEGEERHFRLLRCSTNLAGPTVDFQNSDHEIVNALNDKVPSIFYNAALTNHVLAQIYVNDTDANKKQHKATIKAHADKTKDMPTNGIMAFCTFYDDLQKLKPIGRFDLGHKGISGLTKLHFCLKDCLRNDPVKSKGMEKQFSVTMYPDSVFFMPLSTNRLYTHEIRPGSLDAHMLPTRMGYVVRCSDTEAVHKRVDTADKNSASITYIKNKQGGLTPLQAPTNGGLTELHRLYKEENKSIDYIDYGKDRFLFSMNEGDYAMPQIYNGGKDEFRKLQLDAMLPSDTAVNATLFQDLKANTKFEALGRSRQGAVLSLPQKNNGRWVTPIVRTTTKYNKPAQIFHPLHQEIARRIQKKASQHVAFNNALAEVYGNAYKKMGFHSDQAQDLLDGSIIALFTCYKEPTKRHNRKLVVEPKEGNPDGEKFEIPLTHNSVVLFSLDTNRRFRHKIVWDCPHNQDDENEWMGLTFRTSKTFVTYDDTKEGAIFPDGTKLRLLDNDTDCTMYQMRARENREICFRYPWLDFTISKSDIMQPENSHNAI